MSEIELRKGSRQGSRNKEKGGGRIGQEETEEEGVATNLICFRPVFIASIMKTRATMLGGEKRNRNGSGGKKKESASETRDERAQGQTRRGGTHTICKKNHTSITPFTQLLPTLSTTFAGLILASQSLGPSVGALSSLLPPLPPLSPSTKK